MGDKYYCDTCIYAIAMFVRHKTFVTARNCKLLQKGECSYQRNEPRTLVDALREKSAIHDHGMAGCQVVVEKALLAAAADLIEQLEMDLENTRRCLGDRMQELQDAEEEIEALKSDLDSITRDGNPFEAIMLREKWGLGDA